MYFTTGYNSTARYTSAVVTVRKERCSNQIHLFLLRIPLHFIITVSHSYL